MHTFLFSLITALFSFAPILVSAHTLYVIDPAVDAPVPVATQVILSELFTTHNILLILATIFVVFTLYIIATRTPVIRNYLDDIHDRLAGYREFIPWVLRLSLGLLLIGGAISGHLISPIVPIPEPLFAVLQLVLGFGLLAGIFTTPITIAVLIVYLGTLFNNSYLLGMFEIFGATLGLLLWGSNRPSIDHIFGIPGILTGKYIQEFAIVFLRIGIGVSLAYLALYEKFIHSELSLAVVEHFHLTTVIGVSAGMWVLSSGIIELLIGICLILGFRTRLISAVAFVVLCITFFAFKEDVTSHVALFGILSALFITGGGRYSIDGFIDNLHRKRIQT